MTHDELQAIKARADGATPGPWEAKAYGPYPLTTRVYGKSEPPTVAEMFRAEDRLSAPYYDQITAADLNAAFIAHARTDVPALIAEVERLQRHSRALKRLRLFAPSEASQDPAAIEEVLERIVDFILQDRGAELREGSHDM